MLIYSRNDILNMCTLSAMIAVDEYSHWDIDNCKSVQDMEDMPEREEGMSKRFKERVRIGTDENGKALYKFAEGNTKDEVHRSIYRILERAKAAQEKPARTKHVFADYIRQWFDTYKRPALAPTTTAKCESAIRARLLPYFGKMAVEDITPGDVQMYLNGKSNYAKETRHFDLRILGPLFDSAVEDGIIAANPARSKRVRLTSKRCREGKALPPEETRRIIERLPELAVTDRLYFVLMLCMGLRPCEARGLQWGDIANGKAHIQRNATFPREAKPCVGPVKAAKSNRVLPIPDIVAAILEEHRRACDPSSDEEFLFGGAEPITHSRCRCMEARIKKVLNLDCRIYDLRHTAITAAYEGTKNAAAAAAYRPRPPSLLP